MKTLFFRKVPMFFVVSTAVLLGLSSVGEASIISDLGVVPCSKAAETEFVPSWGQVKVGEYSDGRYITQYIYWHDKSRLKWFADNPAGSYEPDAFFYNYYDKGKPLPGAPAYGDKASGYWSSDLPIPYVDTQEFDPSGEKSVTIGSANANKLVPKKLYLTNTHMKSGKGSSSWIKLQSQRGKLDPADCRRLYAHCSYGCNGTNNVKTIDFQKHWSVPGCYQFKYEWNGTAPTTCR
jgi:hypothetical protein